MTVGAMALRPATSSDPAAVAEVWLRSFDAALPTVRRAHSDDDVCGCPTTAIPASRIRQAAGSAHTATTAATCSRPNPYRRM